MQVYEHGHTPDGAAYLIMELLVGETLRERLRRHPGGLGPASLHIARQLATALAACHAKGIVHRVLKSSSGKLEEAIRCSAELSGAVRP